MFDTTFVSPLAPFVPVAVALTDVPAFRLRCNACAAASSIVKAGVEMFHCAASTTARVPNASCAACVSTVPPLPSALLAAVLPDWSTWPFSATSQT